LGLKRLDLAVGIVRFVIHQAKELDQSKSLSGDLNPLSKVYINHATSSSFATPCFKHTNSPVWEAPYEFLCTDKASTVITVKVIDDRDFLKDPVIGYMSIKLTDLIEAKLHDNRDWFPLSGCKQGKVRISAEWKPLAMAGSLHGSDQYKPPIGVVKLLLDKAVDVKYVVSPLVCNLSSNQWCRNVEATLGGKVCNFLVYHRIKNLMHSSSERPLRPSSSTERYEGKDRSYQQQWAFSFSFV